MGSRSLLQGIPNPGIEPRSSTLQADSSPAELPGKPFLIQEQKPVGFLIFFFSILRGGYSVVTAHRGLLMAEASLVVRGL